MQKPKTVWVFDENHRVYHDSEGNKLSTPDYRSKWVPHEVVGETSRSWILGGWEERKVPKNLKWPQTRVYCFSEEEVDDKVWENDHAVKISQKVSDADAKQLREIAKIIGYEEKK